MDGMDKMMRDMERMQSQIKTLQEQMDAIAKYLKMAFKYTAETYEMVKPEELAKEMGVPTQVR